MRDTIYRCIYDIKVDGYIFELWFSDGYIAPSYLVYLRDKISRVILNSSPLNRVMSSYEYDKFKKMFKSYESVLDELERIIDCVNIIKS